jgi:hypothetical protein
MARDRQTHAQNREVPTAPLDAAAMPSKVPIPLSLAEPQYQDQILALVRALARDAARMDHEADQITHHRQKGSCKTTIAKEK